MTGEMLKKDLEEEKALPWLLILEDTKNRIDRMTMALNEIWGRESWELTSDASIAVSLLESQYSSFAVISLDHDLFSIDGSENLGMGMDVVVWLEQHTPTARIIIHSANDLAASEMFERLTHAGFLVRRVFPTADDRWIDDDWLSEVKRLKTGWNG